VIGIVVPAYNEAANLEACVRCLHETFQAVPYDIVIVDDGSGDSTLGLARRLAAERPECVRVAEHPCNLGFGAALETGFRRSHGAHVMCCPADFRMTPQDWAPFAEALGRADVLVGCRVRREGYNPLMRVNAWVYPRLVRRLFGLRLRDVNWICVYRRDLISQIAITQRGIPMMVEVLVSLRDLGATFHEVDCRMQPRQFGTPSAARFTVMYRTLRGLLEFWRAYRPPSQIPNVTSRTNATRSVNRASGSN
jgi:glycosyltransferase involved in cell wall biosynthesis